MKVKFIILVLATILSVSSFARDFYAFADATQNKTQSSDSQYLNDFSDSGYNLGVGYAFSEMFSLELAYKDMFSVSQDVDVLLHFYSSLSSELNAIQVSAIANHRLNEKLGFYGRLGISEIKHKYSYEQYVPSNQTREADSGSDRYSKPMIGVGLDYSLNNQLGLRVEYNLYSKIEDTAISSFSAGVYFNF